MNPEDLFSALRRESEEMEDLQVRALTTLALGFVGAVAEAKVER